MTFRVLALLFALMVTLNAVADLKPDIVDCNAKKAARNAAMGATVGISGRCDAEKAAKKAKENVADNVKDSADIDRDNKKRLSGGNTDKRGLNKNKD